MPPIDIFESTDTVIMLLQMPGVDPASLNVTLDKRAHDLGALDAVGAARLHAGVRRRDGNYERAFMLSDQVDDEHIEAVLKDGFPAS